MTNQLPPLPVFAHRGSCGTGDYFSSYTAEQMRDYARAALAQQPAQPVAFMWQHNETGRTGFVEAGFDRAHWEEHNPRLAIVSPLYAAPQQAAPAPLWECKAGGLKDLTDAQYQAQPEKIRRHYTQQAAPDEPDMRHPKIQLLIGAKARRGIELQLVEQLLDDPDCELTSLDMEYWNSMHDKLHDKLTAASQQPAPAQPDPLYLASDGTFYPIPRKREPLTQAQVLRLFNGLGVTTNDRFKLGSAAIFTRIVRLAEAAHGITAPTTTKERGNV